MVGTTPPPVFGATPVHVHRGTPSVVRRRGSTTVEGGYDSGAVIPPSTHTTHVSTVVDWVRTGVKGSGVSRVPLKVQRKTPHTVNPPPSCPSFYFSSVPKTRLQTDYLPGCGEKSSRGRDRHTFRLFRLLERPLPTLLLKRTKSNQTLFNLLQSTFVTVRVQIREVS